MELVDSVGVGLAQLAPKPLHSIAEAHAGIVSDSAGWRSESAVREPSGRRRRRSRTPIRRATPSLSAAPWSRGTIRKIGKPPTGMGEWLEDQWRRRNELLLERLAVSWEIAGLPLTEQKLLLGRYRMADPATQRWVRETIATHVERFFPELLA